VSGYFDCLEVGAQEEVKQLAADLSWSIEKATQQYLQTASSMAAIRAIERAGNKAPVLEMVQVRATKKGLKRCHA